MDHNMVNKINDLELGSFAHLAKSEEKRTVIVELATPPPKVRLDRFSENTKSLPKYRSTKSTERKSRINIRNIEGHKKDMDLLGGRLSKLGIPKDSLTRLDSAQAFIVSVYPEQLRNILRMKLTGIVRPNRVHKLSRD